MQVIAGEFNLSETVFVLPPRKIRCTRRACESSRRSWNCPLPAIRLFGTAIALAEDPGRLAGDDGTLIMLEEKVGDVRCVVSQGEGASFAEFDLPRLSQSLEFDVPQEMIAAALGQIISGRMRSASKTIAPSTAQRRRALCDRSGRHARRRRQGQARPEALERIRADDRLACRPTPMSTAARR